MLRSISLAIFLAFAAFAQEQLIDWQGDYHQALAEAKATGKPVFLEFRCEA